MPIFAHLPPIVKFAYMYFEKPWKISILNPITHKEMKPNPMKRATLLALLLSSIVATAQVTSGGRGTTPPPVAYTSVNQLNMLLSQLEQVAQSTTADLSKLRIDKWKTDSSNKRQTQEDVASIQRNLQSALPEILNQLRTSPEDLSATFKLYRNLDALYDVFGPVVESAGAFGSKDDFQSLQNDLTSLERSRRSLAERMDNLTVSKEAELSRLRTQVKNLAAPSAPSKKIIVDDTEAPKKPAKKKSSNKPTKPNPSAQQQSQQPQPH